MSDLRQRQPVVPRRRKLTRAERDYERWAQQHFRLEVLRLDMGCCIGTVPTWYAHTCRPPLRAHHVVKQQWLRTYCRTLEYDILGGEGWTENRITDFLWDPANGITVCDGLHEHHHDGTEWRIPLEWLPGRVLDFADAWRIRHILEREHPSSTRDDCSEASEQ